MILFESDEPNSCRASVQCFFSAVGDFDTAGRFKLNGEYGELVHSERGFIEEVCMVQLPTQEGWPAFHANGDLRIRTGPRVRSGSTLRPDCNISTLPAW